MRHVQVEICPDGTTFSTVCTYFVAAAINTVGAVTLIAALPILGRLGTARLNRRALRRSAPQRPRAPATSGMRIDTL